jgi:branched-chain amino acid transport system substrate-binding protein
VRKLFVPALLLGLLMAATGCLPRFSTRPTYKIGLVGPFEGLYRHLGYDALRAVELAMTEHSERDGVSGYAVELVVLNDDQDPQSAIQRAREMAVDPDVVGVIGHFGEETTVAALSVYREAGLALVVPAMTSVAVTNSGYDQTYRLVTDSCAIGQVAARYAVLEKGARRVAVVGSAEEQVLPFVASARVAGAEVSVHQGPDRAVLTSELVGENPDLVYLAGKGIEGADLLLALRQSGLEVSILGGSGLDMPQFVQVAGDATEGMVYLSVAPDLQDRSFGEAYRELSGAQPGPVAALSYDATGLLLDTAERCISQEGRPSRPCVAQSLGAVRGYEGLTGRISFDQHGQATGRPVYLYEIVEGQYPGRLLECPRCSP